jgi:hypothetical protein
MIVLRKLAIGSPPDDARDLRSPSRWVAPAMPVTQRGLACGRVGCSPHRGRDRRERPVGRRDRGRLVAALELQLGLGPIAQCVRGLRRGAALLDEHAHRAAISHVLGGC